MKGIRIAAIALCITLMVLPSSAIPFFQQHETGAEYRSLAPFPTLVDEDDGLNLDFAGEFEAWLGDHFAFRSAAVRANALANYRLLHTSVNDDVIAGRDGWLYYADTVPDYTGEGRLAEAELDRMVENLGAMSESLAARGARLCIAVIPDKSTIYPQYMPGRYPRRADGGNIPRLRAACAGLSATWIDLVQPLEDAAMSGAPVYYQTDTHWNALGACVAADAILKALGRGGTGDCAVVGQESYDRGDLARLMGAQGSLRESVPVVRAERALPQADYSLHALEVDGNGDGRLLVFRDSFGTAIGPYLAREYARTELRWESPLEAWHRCDDALILIAERNLRLYLMEAPELYADDGDFEDGDDAGDGDFEDGDDAGDWDFEDENDAGDGDFEDEDDAGDEDFEDEDFDGDGVTEAAMTSTARQAACAGAGRAGHGI